MRVTHLRRTVTTKIDGPGSDDWAWSAGPAPRLHAVRRTTKRPGVGQSSVDAVASRCRFRLTSGFSTSPYPPPLHLSLPSSTALSLFSTPPMLSFAFPSPLSNTIDGPFQLLIIPFTLASFASANAQKLSLDVSAIPAPYASCYLSSPRPNPVQGIGRATLRART
ncbi:hypothetical protein NMY22_g9791 [Coprinellus aureogranulatus]|nr:hypothetical protein NMY22_g9791 [Coprinellus aureogranulatus]